MSYLIYLPAVRAGNPEELRRVGLGELTEDGAMSFMHVEHGPDGGEGSVGAWIDPLKPRVKLGHFAELQDWQPAKPGPGREGGRYWLGREKGFDVTPQLLARPKQHPGLEIPLADGHRWLIPVATQLPHRWGMGDNGLLTRIPKDRYKEFCERSEKVFDELASIGEAKPGDKVGFGESWDYACMALAINYRVNEDLVDFLELLDDRSAGALIAATVELELIDAVNDQKKSSE